MPAPRTFGRGTTAALIVLGVITTDASAQTQDVGNRIWSVRQANATRDHAKAVEGARSLLGDAALTGVGYGELRADAALHLYFGLVRLGRTDEAEKAYATFVAASKKLRQPHRLIDQMVELRRAFDADVSALAGVGAKPFVPPDDPTWTAAKPVAAGLDVAALQRLVGLSRDAGGDALLVVHRGRIVHEHYTPRYREPMFTMSSVKSMTGLLVGLAIEDGAIAGIDDEVGKYLPSWREGRRGEVTIRHLLTMSAGLPRMRGAVGVHSARDKNAFVAGLEPGAAPGTRFVYSNEGVQLLGAVLRAALQRPLADYAAERLFAPCGMAATALRTDGVGHAITYADARTTLRDFARLGVVMLDDGRWNDRQVVPKAWVAAALRPSKTNAGYGYLWWLYPGIFAMEGYLSTSVWVLPDRDLVVARVQSRPSLLAEGPFDEPAARALMAEIAPARAARPQGTGQKGTGRKGAQGPASRPARVGAETETAPVPARERAGNLFRALDKNRDGRFVRGEAASVALWNVLVVADANGDGVIRQGELIAACVKHAEGAAAPAERAGPGKTPKARGGQRRGGTTKKRRKKGGSPR